MELFKYKKPMMSKWYFILDSTRFEIFETQQKSRTQVCFQTILYLRFSNYITFLTFLFHGVNFFQIYCGVLLLQNRYCQGRSCLVFCNYLFAKKMQQNASMIAWNDNNAFPEISSWEKFKLQAIFMFLHERNLIAYLSISTNK